MNCNSQSISVRRRLIPIYTVLNVMPTYIMSLFSVPVNVVKRRTSLAR